MEVPESQLLSTTFLLNAAQWARYRFHALKKMLQLHSYGEEPSIVPARTCVRERGMQRQADD